MAFSGQVLENPISGERFTFRKTAADTDGELLAWRGAGALIPATAPGRLARHSRDATHVALLPARLEPSILSARITPKSRSGRWFRDGSTLGFGRRVCVAARCVRR